MRPFRRFFPLTASSAAMLAYRHRRPLWDWGTWIARSVPRVVSGEGDDVLTEARLRLKLAMDDRLDGDRIRVDVEDGRALVSGDVARGHREVVAALVKDAPGVERVSDVLHERSRGQAVSA
jgi:BON domain